MPSFNVARLDKKISEDIPDISAVLKALAKWDVSGFTDIPDGSLRMTLDVKNQGTIEKYSGSWSPVTKLMHDVDKLDGYHASTSASANTIVVRDKNGAIPGNILGNAATATEAGGFSDGVTLPVSQGGTGATTASQARTNLGVPPTSHASSGTAYGLGSNLNYGHVRGDGETTNVIDGEIVVKDVLYNSSISLASSGLLGRAKYISRIDTFNIDTDDFDLLLVNTYYENSSGTFPNFSGFVYIRQYYYSRTSPTVIGNRMQVAFAYNANKMWRRYCLNGEWSSWVKVIDETDLSTMTTPGIVKPDTVNGTIDVDVKGRLYVVKAPYVIAYDTNTASNQYKDLCTAYRYAYETSKNSRTAVFRAEAGDTYNSACMFSTSLGNTFGAEIRAITHSDNRIEITTNCELSVNNGNSVVIAANTLETGDLVASMNSSRRGCLLCNGAAVSRTTYVNLFAILGTAFGEGDGSTTFNLPDFRDKTLWGANGNLMSILTAGLPNIEAGLSIGALCQNASGAITIKSSHVLRASTDASNSSGFNFNAGKSNSIYGKSTTVQPPAIAVNIFIKY